ARARRDNPERYLENGKGQRVRNDSCRTNVLFFCHSRLSGVLPKKERFRTFILRSNATENGSRNDKVRKLYRSQ
ncbi:MAG: hypothetical protein Q7T83_13405, partial [Thermodesulfovibrionales bacterium]|nr:hypothetical protein [Thermodesulfovibrionales bacterium]